MTRWWVWLLIGFLTGGLAVYIAVWYYIVSASGGE